ncbi:MAG: hypothetical protein ACKOFF_03320 [Acidimicrobiales bacterium]
MRRLLITLALIGGTLVGATSPASADSAESVNGTLRASMSKIASGMAHSCRVLDSGHVVCWGLNTNGQLGDDSTSPATKPVLVRGISTATSVAVGAIHTCAVLADTTVKCWGRGEFGRIGDGNGAGTDRKTPVTVCADAACTTSLSGVESLALSYEATCALKTNGTVWCWGDNNDWQLGTDPSTSVTGRTYAGEVTGLTGVKAISAGDYHTCVILNDDTAKCWGMSNAGQLGNGSFSSATPTTVTIGGITTVKAIAGGYGHTCVIKPDDVVGCWGSNWRGETGSGAGSMYETSLVTPQISSADVTAKAISITASMTCVITLADQIACWGGYMDGGSFRHAGFNNSSQYAREVLTGSSGATAVAAGMRHGCALFGSSMKCWGLNEYSPGNGAGALANNSTASSADAFVTSMNAVVPVITLSDPGAKTTADGTFTVTVTNSASRDTLLFAYNSAICNVTAANTVTIYSAGNCQLAASSNDETSGNVKYFLSTSNTRTVVITQSAPVTTAGSATSVTSSGATLAGTVNPALAESTVTWAWSTSNDVTTATTASGTTLTGSGAQAVTKAVTGLSAGTKYWFWVKSTNTAGTTTSSAGTFTTNGSAPVVTTGSTSSVSSSRATLNGVVNPGEMETSVWFTIGQKSDLSDGTRIDYRSITGTTDTDVSVTATGLTESTRYYYRAEASNGLGSTKGDIKSFTASRPLGITINDAAEFTNSRRVTVYATGPSGSTQVILSNDGGFGGAQTFDLVDGYAEIGWTLVASRDERLPKTVYARFVQRFGSQSSTNTDDIILDTTAPNMSGVSGSATSPSSSNVSVQSVRASAKGAVKLFVRARDANSGIGKVQVKTSANGRITDVPTSSPKASSRTVRVNTTKKRLWVRVVDRAGNVSRWVTVTVK